MLTYEKAKCVIPLACIFLWGELRAVEVPEGVEHISLKAAESL